jgi:hypothetical protein
MEFDASFGAFALFDNYGKKNRLRRSDQRIPP